jgi:two-component system, sensor histidine kinase and response regulator
MYRARRSKTSQPGLGDLLRQALARVLTGVVRRRPSLRAFRVYVESLSLTDQLRVSAIAALTAGLLGAQLFATVWDALATHHRDQRLASDLAHSIAGHVEKAGTYNALAPLARYPVILGGDLHLDTGEVLEMYDAKSSTPTVHGDDPSSPVNPVPHGRTFLQRVMRFFWLVPDYNEYPVVIDSRGPGVLAIVIDHKPPWIAIAARAVQTPFVLALGLLIGLLAARSLRRQIVEPLEQLVRSTRVSDTPVGESAQGGAPGGNELTQLASNFNALSDRLSQYERDMTTLRVASRKEVIERTHEIEQQLRDSEAVMRSKDEFLANMSHEIRTPMNGVLGMAELLTGTDLDKRQRRYVDSMRSAADTMMKIINDILDDSKIAAGKMELVREVFDVREFVEQVGEVFAARAESKKLELVCRVEPTVPAAVVGDALRLRQVLGNLLSNAVKYTEQGEIQIRIGLDNLAGDDCRLYFNVADTGTGIREADQAAVFEAFSQLGNAQRVGGTGLGLSIASRLVRLMGGEKIELRSEPGKGSSFSFVLPFKVDAAAPAPDGVIDEFSGMRVMVVDDSPTTYMYLDETLSNWSVDVTVLNQGRLLADKLREAVARRRPYEAVLLDHALPDATTAELLRAIRLDPLLAGTWVVLLSAFDFDPSYEGARAIRPDMCIAKPVRQTLLKNALRAAREPREPDEVVARREPEAREAAPQPEGLLSLGLDVLVADDNVINREVAQAMLERVGCRVTVADDGNAALDHANRRAFDAILMDCQMPGMDGYAATAAIRRLEAERGSKATPIVALTANVLARDRSRCTEAGMNHFLPKPFTQDQMVAVLRPIAMELGKLVQPQAAAVPVNDTRPARPPAEVRPTTPAGEARAARPAVMPQAPRPAAAPHAAVTAGTPDPDMMQLDFGTPSEAAGPVLGETAAAAMDNYEPLLSDTTVLSILEDPTVQDDGLSAVPLLDAEQVAAIRGLGRPQVFERLCQLLFTTAPESLKRLDAALDAGDLQAIAAVAHSLKSPVNSLGGRRLAEQLERCEIAALEARDANEARRVAAGVKQTYADLEAALRVESGRATGT